MLFVRNSSDGQLHECNLAASLSAIPKQRSQRFVKHVSAMLESHPALGCSQK